MNRNQWFVSAFFLMMFSIFLVYAYSTPLDLVGDTNLSAFETIRVIEIGIATMLGTLSFFLGILFIVLGYLEPKKKH